MKRHGLDSLTSWIIAFACCICNTMILGTGRLSGILFLASISRYCATREKAAFPYSCAFFIRNITGPLAGYLGQRFGVRKVTIIGCILATIGVGMCFIAESIYTVIILWGLIFGLGFGLGNILLPAFINQHFDKYRATASGIALSGASIGSFILPPIAQVLIKEYGLSGTFLILSGFVLNCVPAALLLEEPVTEIKKSLLLSNYETHDKLYSVKYCFCTSCSTKREKNGNFPVSNHQIDRYINGLRCEENGRGLSAQTCSTEYSDWMNNSESLVDNQNEEYKKERKMVDPTLNQGEVISLYSFISGQISDSEENSDIGRNNQSLGLETQMGIVADRKIRSQILSSELLPIVINFPKKNKDGNKNYDNDAIVLDSTKHCAFSSNFETQFQNQNTIHNNIIDNTELGLKNIKDFSTNTFNNEENFRISSSQNLAETIISQGSNISNMKEEILVSFPNSKKYKSEEYSLRESFRTIFDPMFIFISLCASIFYFTAVSMLTVIIDFGRDLKIGTSDEKYILMMYSVGDCVGRVGLGWIIDGGYMTVAGFTAFSFACQGLTIIAMIWCDGFIMLIILIILCALMDAAITIMFPVIIYHYIDVEKQTFVIPASHVLAGPLCLAVAPSIGYFRDHIGSYDYLFCLMGIASILCSFSWILAPCIINRRNKKRGYDTK